MRAILHVTTGPAAGRKIPLLSGDTARFGQSDSADVCFADDAAMSPVHFEIECRPDHCLVRDLGSGAPTFVNDQPVEQATVANDDLISAGATTLLVQHDGVRTGVDGESGEPDTEEPPAPVFAAEVCQPLSLGEEAMALLTPEQSPEEFVAVLIEHQHLPDAIRFQAAVLDPRAAIGWALICQEEMIANDTPAEKSAYQASLAWMADPTDELRRAAMEAGEKSGFHTAAGMTAAAIFWGGDSISAPDMPAVPPSPELTGQGVFAALQIVANLSTGGTLKERYRKVLAVGAEVADGSRALPGDSASE